MPGREVEVTIRRLRRDLRGLSILEYAQRLVAIGALVGIALRTIVHTHDARTTISLVTVVLLALAYLALAFRIRLGAELVRRDLWLLEASEELERAEARRVDATASVHPYRSVPSDVQPPDICPCGRLALRGLPRVTPRSGGAPRVQ